MKKIGCILAAACLLAGSAPCLPGGDEALAQADPLPDGIGIFADMEATVNEVTAEPGTLILVHLLATRTTQPLGGWECSIEPPPNAQTWGYSPANPEAILLKRDSALMCGTGIVLPAADIVHLLDFAIMMTDDQPGYFFVRPHPLDSGGFGSPAYVVDAVNEVLLPLHPYPRLQDQPAFVVNAAPQPVTAATWGGIKALFGL